MSASPLGTAFKAAMQALPLVAILRGLTPAEAVAVGDALYGAGFRLIEVPLNSPQPFLSIERLRAHLPADALVGAGTLLRTEDVPTLRAAGGQLAVMPHADTVVIRAARDAGLICIPGIATPTEAFAALAAGAHALKLFPAELVTPAVLKAMRAVLPREVALLPVGGISPHNMAPFVAAGARGFGLGSALFAPGMSSADVATRASGFVNAWRALQGDAVA